MTSNNLPPADAGREGEDSETSLRDHRVILSLTAEEWDSLRSLVPALEVRLERRVLPIGTAAYHIFRRGLQLELEGAAA